jgi:hypothetical protein
MPTRKLRMPGRRKINGGGASIGTKVLQSNLSSHPEFSHLNAGEIENLYEFEIVTSNPAPDEPTILGEAAKMLMECFRGLISLPGRRRKKQREKQLHMTKALYEKINAKIEECEEKVDGLNIAIAKCVKSGDRMMAKQRKYINQISLCRVPREFYDASIARSCGRPCPTDGLVSRMLVPIKTARASPHREIYFKDGQKPERRAVKS